MQTSDLSKSIKELTDKLFSPDPISYNSAINLYAEPNLSYSTSLLFDAHGASKLKKALFLQSWFVRRRVRIRPSEDKELGKKRKEWDEDSQTLTIKTLTSYGLPIALPLLDLTIKLPSTLILHLNVNEDGENGEGGLGVEGDDATITVIDGEDVGIHSDGEEDDNNDDGESVITAPGSGGTKVAGDFASAEGVVSATGSGPSGAKADEEVGEEIEKDLGREKVYYITKWEDKGVLGALLEKVSLIEKIHVHLIRPIISTQLLLLASVLLFWNAHPLRDGIFKFIVAAVLAVWNEMTMEVGRRLGGSWGVASDGKFAASKQSASSASSSKEKSKPQISNHPSYTTYIPSSNPTPKTFLNPGKSQMSVHHSGISAEAAKVDGTSYAEVTAATQLNSHNTDATATDSTAPGAMSYAEVVTDK